MILFMLHNAERNVFTRSCHTLRQTFLSCRWAGLTCSMYRLVRRSRYCEVPHWTADTCMLLRLLRQPMFERLEYMRLLIDTPCFDSSPNPWVHPDVYKKSHSLPITTLDITAIRRNFARPSPRALHRLVTLCTNLATICLSNIKNLGNDVLRSLLKKNRGLKSVSIRNCLFTETARNTLVRCLTSSHPGGYNGVQWPHSLLHLEMTGRAIESIMRTVSRFLHDVPMNLPLHLVQLNMQGAIEQLQDVQLLMTLSFLPDLREIVLHEKHYATFDMLFQFQPSLFPKLRFFL